MTIDKTRISINHVITTARVTSIAERNENVPSFQKVLQDTLDSTQDVKFSKHATMRMEERNISLSPDEINKMREAINKAKVKGLRDSLVLMNDMAFVVNIPSRTVVTAVDGKTMRENIFTNIDGAVIL